MAIGFGIDASVGIPSQRRASRQASRSPGGRDRVCPHEGARTRAGHAYAQAGAAAYGPQTFMFRIPSAKPLTTWATAKEAGSPRSTDESKTEPSASIPV
jgi:hypothetical protein